MACEDSHGGQEYSGCREVLFLVSEGPTQNLTDWQETSSAWNFDHLTNNGDTATSTLESTSVAPERDDADAKGAEAAIQLLGLPLPELSFFPDRPLSHSLPSTLNQAWRLRHNSSSVSDDDSLQQPRQLHGSWPQHELLRAKSATAQLAAPAPSSIPPATPFAQLPAASSSGFPQPRPGFSQPLSHPITEQFKEMVSHMRPQPLDELLPAIPLFSGQQLQLQQQGRAASGLSAEQAASWHESAADWMTASHLSLPGSFLPAASLPSSHTALGLPFTHPSTHSLRSASNRAGPLLEPSATAERENSSSKRVHREELEEEEGMLERSGGRGSKRPRLVWTQELHTRFLNAVNHLGLKDAVPKTILQLMNVEGMTRENVASHLQKYRLHLKRATGLPPGAQLPPDTLQYLGRAAPSAGPAAEPAQASGTLPAAAFASMPAAAPAFPEAMPKYAVTTISSFSHVPLPLAWMAHEQQTWQPPVGMPPFGSHMQPSLVNPSTQAAAAFGGASLPAPNLLQHAIPMMAGPKGVPQWVWGSPAHLSTNPENGAPPSLNGAPPMGQSLAGEQDEAAGASRIPFVGPDFSREKHGELMTDTGPAAGAQHSSSLGEAAASSCSSPGD